LRADRLVSTGLADGWPDLAETAAVLANLDLIIAADTAVAHLAGALGRPVWMALAKPAEWRWLLKREDTPRHPSMRLFRQVRRGDGEEVFQRMAQVTGICLPHASAIRGRCGGAALAGAAIPDFEETSRELHPRRHG
jgi:hypothetical protein